MTYKTTNAIRDTPDNAFCYIDGEIFPRQGLERSKERLRMLVKNGYIVAEDEKKHEPMIEAGEETKKNKKKLTAKEIKDKLDELRVEYKSSASKAELLALLEEDGGE